MRTAAVAVLLLASGAITTSNLDSSTVILDNHHHHHARATINNTTLFVSSFLFHRRPVPSAWVDRLFCALRVSFSRNETLASPVLEHHVHEAMARTSAVHDGDTCLLPDYAQWPACSAELLAFVSLDDTHGAAFRRFAGVQAGGGRLSVTTRDGVDCWYRSLYDSWRPAPRPATAPHYQAVFVTCPVPTEAACRRLQAVATGVGNPAALLDLVTPTRTLRAPFHLRSTSTPPPTPTAPPGTALTDHLRRPAVACLVLPYSSSDAVKAATVNRALVAEWVAHHSALGFHVLVYDRRGASKHALYNASGPVGGYLRARGLFTADDAAVTYHGYTVKGVAEGDRHQARRAGALAFDNNEMDGGVGGGGNGGGGGGGDGGGGGHSGGGGGGGRRVGAAEAAMDATDDDKSLTLTHCRFEAKARLGAEAVLVADADEFLLCPSAGPTLPAQRDAVRRLLRASAAAGYDQILLQQVTAANRTDYLLPCLTHAVASGRPVFDCFAHTRHSRQVGMHLFAICYHTSFPVFKV